MSLDAGYLRIFRLLWTIKHVEHVLAAGWRTINDMQHGLATVHALHSREGIDVSNIEQASLGQGLGCVFGPAHGEWIQEATNTCCRPALQPCCAAPPV